MEEIKFSLILNSRLRATQLIGLFDSIIKTTKNLNDIEVLVSFDNDDFDSVCFLSDLKTVQHPILDVLRFYFIDRERNLHKRLNHLASLATGKYIFVLNDDTQILTKNWDTTAYNILETSFDDNIVYGATQDNSCDKRGDYSSFPIISKKAVDTIGYFMSEHFSGLGADVHIWRVYQSVNRIVDTQISIRHLLHETLEKVINADITALEMRSESYKSDINEWNLSIEQERTKLNEKIFNNI